MHSPSKIGASDLLAVMLCYCYFPRVTAENSSTRPLGVISNAEGESIIISKVE